MHGLTASRRSRTAALQMLDVRTKFDRTTPGERRSPSAATIAWMCDGRIAASGRSPIFGLMFQSEELLVQEVRRRPERLHGQPLGCVVLECHLPGARVDIGAGDHRRRDLVQPPLAVDLAIELLEELLARLVPIAGQPLAVLAFGDRRHDYCSSRSSPFSRCWLDICTAPSLGLGRLMVRAPGHRPSGGWALSRPADSPRCSAGGRGTPGCGAVARGISRWLRRASRCMRHESRRCVSD